MANSLDRIHLLLQVKHKLMEDNGVYVLAQLGKFKWHKIFQRTMTDYLHNNEPVSKPKSVHHKCDVRTV